VGKTTKRDQTILYSLMHIGPRMGLLTAASSQDHYYRRQSIGHQVSPWGASLGSKTRRPPPYKGLVARSDGSGSMSNNWVGVTFGSFLLISYN
jgi:hypothetical protein